MSMAKQKTRPAPKHALGDECPACRKLAFCDHCNECEACNFQPAVITASDDKCRNPTCNLPYCAHCGCHERHNRRCSLALRN